MRSLSSALRRRIGELAFVYRRTMPDFVSPSADEGYGSFEDELAFRATTTRRSPSSFFGPSTTMAACVTLRCSRTPRCASVRAAPPGTAHLRGPARADARARRAARRLLGRGVRRGMDRLEPQLAAAVTDAGRTIASEGLYALLRGLSPRLRVDAAREEFGLDIHDHRVEITESDRLVLVPSAFVWPHVRVNCDEPWPLSVIYPASFVVADARPRIPLGRPRPAAARARATRGCGRCA